MNSPCSSLLSRDTFGDDVAEKPWSKPDVSLHAVLDEAELLNDCRAELPDLMNYLTAPDHLKSLVDVIITPKADGASEDERYKYPYIVAQLFTLGVAPLLRALASDDSLAHWFSVLDSTTPLQTLQAEYWSKVTIKLLSMERQRLLAYLLPRKPLLCRLFAHLGAPGVPSVYAAVLSALSEDIVDETHAAGRVDQILTTTSAQWLVDARCVDLLLSRFDSRVTSTDHAHAAEAMRDTVAHCADTVSPLLLSLYSGNTAASLLRNVMGGVASSVEFSCDALVALLEWAAAKPARASHAAALVRELCVGVPSLRRLLATTPAPLLGDVSSARVGMRRYKAVQLVAALLPLTDVVLVHTLRQSGVLAACLDLFFEFHDNNLLHVQVASLVHATLLSTTAETRAWLFDECKLLPRALTALQHAEKQWNERGIRRPDIGFLHTLLNVIARAGAQYGDIAQRLRATSEWEQRIVPLLAEINSEQYRTLGEKPISTGDSGGKDWATSLKVD